MSLVKIDSHIIDYDDIIRYEKQRAEPTILRENETTNNDYLTQDCIEKNGEFISYLGPGEVFFNSRKK